MFRFHLAETLKADKNPATFERKTVDKTQFDNCRNVPNFVQKIKTLKKSFRRTKIENQKR